MKIAILSLGVLMLIATACTSAPLIERIIPLVSPTPIVICPPSVAVPAPLPRIHTQEQLGAFAIELELAREAERARGDACSRTVAELRERPGEKP
jgi:hypothetical protein